LGVRAVGQCIYSLFVHERHRSYLESRVAPVIFILATGARAGMLLEWLFIVDSTYFSKDTLWSWVIPLDEWNLVFSMPPESEYGGRERE
jgi:hypothetical protein